MAIGRLRRTYTFGNLNFGPKMKFTIPNLSKGYSDGPTSEQVTANAVSFDICF